jgi:hypothetical protein
MSDPHVIKPGRYRHFKGNDYDVIGVAMDSETQQALVVYRALYGERGLWVRPLAMFTEVIERDGKRMPASAIMGEALNNRQQLPGSPARAILASASDSLS